ncbi:CPBP family intramembrane glutamic endopeptidase [Gaetbulibacter sp. M240]|uniref:CPBP family intramembrane glutamic endopeptidase n=1 Tax=Gaetbulibacter sp. M240 TaxID=3126511 RepID=UPI00374E522B
MKINLIRKVIILSVLLPVLVILNLVFAAFFFGKSENFDNYNSIVIVISFVIVLIISKRFFLLNFGREKFIFKEFLIATILAIFLFIIFYFEKVLFDVYIKSPISILMIFSIVLCLPIVEELFVKKVILDNLILIGYKKIFVILIPSIYFAILHFPEIYMTHLFVGLITSWVYYKNKSILQVILIHFQYNLFIVVFNYL